MAMHALLRHGATVTARDNLANTALHLACNEQVEELEVAVDLLLRWGADETALNDDGKTPAEMLDSGGEATDNRASEDEIERTRMLLSRAPADRAWRRRGWLVMLRSRAVMAGAAMACDGRGDATIGPGTPGGPRERGSCKAARREAAGIGGGDHVVRRQESTGIGVDGGDGDGGVWSGVVGLLVGMEPEGVFRTVLGFL